MEGNLCKRNWSQSNIKSDLEHVLLLSSLIKQTNSSPPSTSGYERAVNGKSLLGVLSLGITGGTTFELVVDGIDETEALDALSELIETDFKDY